MRRIARRKLMGLATGLAGLLVGLRPMAPAADPVLRRAEDIVAGLDRVADAARIGGRFLAQAPEEASIAHLVGVLEPLPRERAALRDTLRARMRADFAAGRMDNVEGWMLARTEVRLYALCAMVHRPLVG